MSRSVVLAVALIGLLAGCAIASGPSPSASPALTPQRGPALGSQAECERNGGV
jgi:hypothetical protein